MSQELLQSALDLAARGWRVFPLKPLTKVPAVKDWPTLATTDPEQIRRVWGGSVDWNIGVACGHGLLGFDIDMKNGKDGLASAAALGVKPEGFVVNTPSGGMHVYFNGPDVSNSAGRLGAGLDVRGGGGYLVGPRSRLPQGEYRTASDGRAVDAPAGLLSQLAGRDDRRSTEPAVHPDRPDAVERGATYLRVVAPLAVEGQGGDHVTFTVAAALKDFGVSQDMAVDLMAEHWNDRCSPPWDHEDLKTKVANAYAYGSRQPGELHPVFEFAGVRVEPPPTTTKPANWFRHGDSYALDTNWLFYETLPATGVAVLLAPTGAGKTFLSIELARALATGKTFFNVEPDDKGGALFVFAGTEGSGFARRLEALGEDKALPISATTCGNLAERGALDKLLADLKDEAAYVLATYGVPVRLIVLETMAASGLMIDENDNGEASRAMSNLAQISRAMNALVLTSHHPSKNGKEARGASAIPSAADYVLTIGRNGKETVREVELTKARDAEERKLGSFTLLPVDLGEDKRGRRITSMTVSTGAALNNATRAAPHAELLLECLEWAIMEDGEDVGGGKKGVDIGSVRDIFKDRKPGSKDKSNVAKVFKVALAYAEQVGALEVVPFNGDKYLVQREIAL